jgi:hypothetical protein
MADKNTEGAAHGNAKPKTYLFFVNGQKFETDQPALTAAQIKRHVSGVEQGDKLSLEGRGDEPDRILADDELVPLAKDHGPLRFTIVPSASFGA